MQKILAAGLLCGLLGCAKSTGPQPGGPTGTLNIQVVQANAACLGTVAVVVGDQALAVRADGAYQVALPAGDYPVRAQSRGGSVTAQATVPANGTVSLTLTPPSGTGTLAGQIAFIDGQPAAGELANLQIKLTGTRPPLVTTPPCTGAVATTDAQGNFKFEHLEVGDYLVATSATPSFAASAATARLESPGASVVANVALQHFAIAGRITLHGNPAAGALVQLDGRAASSASASGAYLLRATVGCHSVAASFTPTGGAQRTGMAQACILATSSVTQAAIELDPSPAPPPRSCSADGSWQSLAKSYDPGQRAVEDRANRRLLAVRGSEVWALSELGTPAGWSRIPISGQALPFRSPVGGAVYDAPSQRLIVFGGRDRAGAPLSDVWALSLPASGPSSWTQITPFGAAPQLHDVRVAYDEGHQRALVFLDVSHVYALSLGAVPAWSQIAANTASIPQPPVGQPYIGYDEAGQRLIGVDGSSNILVLQLGNPDQGSWQVVYPGGSSPGVPTQDLIYDGARSQLIYFRGFSATVSALVLAGQGAPYWVTWQPSQVARTAATGVLDSLNGRLIGLQGFVGLDVLDTWQLPLGGSPTAPWSLLIAGAGLEPKPRAQAAAVYDAANQRMIVFGGREAGSGAQAVLRNDVWSLALPSNLDEVRWSQPAVSGTPPSPRYQHSAVYDAPNQRMIVFGGQTSTPGAASSEVWSLSLPASGPLAWTMLSPAGGPSPARAGHLGVLDAANARLLVYGGSSDGVAFGDLWSLSLAAGAERWTRLFDGAGSPGPGVQPTPAGDYDAANARLVVLAGLVWALPLGQGQAPAWAQLYPYGAAPNTGRAFESLAALADPVRDRLIVHHAGLGAVEVSSETLALDLAPPGDEVWRAFPDQGPAVQSAWVRDSTHDRLVAFGGTTPSSGAAPTSAALTVEQLGACH